MKKNPYLFRVTRLDGRKVLVPQWPHDVEWFDQIAENTELEVSDENTKPSARARRFFWALCGKVCDNHAYWSDKEALADYLKIGTGFVSYAIWPDGSVHTYPRSIAEGSCTYGAFREFLTRAIDLIILRVLPGMDRGVLLREAEKMCGVSYSSVMRLKPDEPPAQTSVLDG